MIQIHLQKVKGTIRCIQVVGHANYAPHGHDIVCASVSTLLQVVAYTLNDYAGVTYNLDESGRGWIAIHQPTRETNSIAKVFEKGATLLAEQYPKNVTLEMS